MGVGRDREGEKTQGLKGKALLAPLQTHLTPHPLHLTEHQHPSMAFFWVLGVSTMDVEAVDLAA